MTRTPGMALTWATKIMSLFYVVKGKPIRPRIDGTTGRGDDVEEALDIMSVANKYDLGATEQSSWFQAWYVNQAPICTWRPGELAALKKARIQFEQELINKGLANVPSYDVRSYISVVVSRTYDFPIDSWNFETA